MSITESSRDVTVSWCLLRHTRQPDAEHRVKGMLIAHFEKPPGNVSLHHNLFVNESQRRPQISTPGLFDIRNNVIRDWLAYGIRIRQGAWGNIVNNTVRSEQGAERAVVLAADAGRVHLSGNITAGGPDINGVTTATSPFAVAPVDDSSGRRHRASGAVRCPCRRPGTRWTKRSSARPWPRPSAAAR